MDDSALDRVLRQGPPDEPTYTGDISALLSSNRTATGDELDASEVGATAVAVAHAADSPKPLRWLAAAAAIVLLIAGLVVIRGWGQGSVTSTTDATAGPPGTTVPPVDTSPPTSLAGRWISSPRSLPTVDASSDYSVLEVSGGVVGFGRGATFGLYRDSSAAPILFESRLNSLSTSVLQVVSTQTGQGCGAYDTGTYRWELTPGGTGLTITPLTDACATRQAAIAGTWTRVSCRNTDDDCLGAVSAGPYRSTNLDLFGTRRYGQLMFDLPTGWANTADFTSNYFIRPAADYAADPASDGNDTVSGIYVWPDVAAAEQDAGCTEVADSAVGTDATSIANWLDAHPGLDVSNRSESAIDGYSTTAMDLRVDPAWTTTCPFITDGSGFVSLVAARPGASVPFMWGIATVEAMRLILIDLVSDHTAAIFIETTKGDSAFASLVTAATPIINSFKFSR